MAGIGAEPQGKLPLAIVSARKRVVHHPGSHKFLTPSCISSIVARSELIRVPTDIRAAKPGQHKLDNRRCAAESGQQEVGSAVVSELALA